MLVIILLVIQVVTLILVIRLSKCGRIVNVHHEHVYVPAKKKKTLPKRVPDDEADYYDE